MDNLAKARRSQALLDSIHELIALERDVSGAINCTFRDNPRKVMVPLTPVAFVPGTITSESVMVGLGQEYYVERTSKQAQEVLQRRITDLSREADVLAESALLPPPSPTQAIPNPTQIPSRPDKKGAWTKGFLTTPRDKPLRGRASSKDAPPATKLHPGAADDHPKQTAFEMKSPASNDDEHTVVLEDGEEDPIMEIKEWLDDSGKQTSVDVTDLGKVMRKAPEGASEPPRVKHPGEQTIVSKKPSPDEIVSDGTGPSDLDSIFARLEEEEASAQEGAKQDSSLSLGPKWKKGFLSGGTKRSATPKPTAKTAGAQETRPATPGRASTTGVPGSQTAPTPRIPNSHAFEGSVVEKTVNASTTTPTLASTGSSQPTAAVPPRVSRFKTRRQGLQ